jgi:hypothetical protein
LYKAEFRSSGFHQSSSIVPELFEISSEFKSIITSSSVSGKSGTSSFGVTFSSKIVFSSVIIFSIGFSSKEIFLSSVGMYSSS